MNSELEREEQYLEDQLANGEICMKEYNKEMREIHDSYRACAEEAAEDAYNDEMDRW